VLFKAEPWQTPELAKTPGMTIFSNTPSLSSNFRKAFCQTTNGNMHPTGNIVQPPKDHTPNPQPKKLETIA
jgi:hypothetical protein